MAVTRNPRSPTRAMAGSRDRGVIYLRVSSSRQADTDYDEEGFSIPAQRGGCQRKAEAMEVPLAASPDYVDRGESAKTADRPALQAMLQRVETDPSIGYVFVHKIDRLARNRADDISIVARIRAAGAQVVSVSENIDETPSGLLLHGIMASIAEFYSRNLATEILKGATQKAKSGGTLGRAPIGYRNVRENIDGREIRTVDLDPERAPLVKHAFELYATGNYTIADLSIILEQRGLLTRPTPQAPSKPLALSQIHAMLHNDYYAGVVRYAGQSYPGRHKELVPLPLFQRVQEMLEAKRIAGERDRVHHHYLKGSLCCGECGGRLVFSRNTGRRGVSYDYFLCRGRQLGTCSQRYRPLEMIEIAVARYWEHIQLTDAQRERAKEVIHSNYDGLIEVAKRELAKAARKLDQLDDQEDKLLERHFADKVSERTYQRQFERIQHERATAEQTLDELGVSYDTLLETLDAALDLTRDIASAYWNASPPERRFLNQSFFERLDIYEDEVAQATVAQPFRDLLDAEFIEKLAQDPQGLAGTPQRADDAAKGPENNRTPILSKVGGSITAEMVELAGLEPATSCMPCRRSPS
jgi:site-specific DNA recombinase